MKIKILASMLAGALAMLPVTANAGWGGGGVGAYGETNYYLRLAISLF